PPYMTIGVAPDAVGRGLQWAPETPAFRLYNDRAPHPLPPAQIPSRPFSVLAHYDDITRSVIRRYAEFWRWRGDALRGAQDCFEARAAYQQALNLAANLPEARAGLNACQSP
ncbi:MAG: hypothetical protein HYR71_09945, partial [Chloroflexi bacterium]|nr:hypothetical protein [Chloroflexota bacterium]